MNTKTDLVIASVGFLLVGAVVFVLGLVMAVTGDPSLLHARHLEGVAPGSYQALAKSCGVAVMLVGAGTPLFGLSLVGPACLRSHRAARLALGVVGLLMLVAGIVFALYAIVSRGGSL